MAVYDLDEQEKLDEIKAWWKQWGNAIIAAVSVFVIVFFGIQWWRGHQQSLAGEAATLFAAVQKAAEEKDPKKIADAAKVIIDKYPKSAYAPRSALFAAKAAFDKGDLGAAVTAPHSFIISMSRSTPMAKPQPGADLPPSCSIKPS